MNQIDNSIKIPFGSDRNLNRDRGTTERILDRIHGAGEISALAIQFVDDDYSGELIFIRPLPNLFGLDFHSGNARDDYQAPINSS